MPTSGPVYQPTTVSYEQQNEWSRPTSYLGQSVGGGLQGARCVPWVLLALSIFSVSAGMIMVVESKFNSHEHDRPEGDTSTDTETKDSNGQLIVTVTGAFLIIIGIFLIGVYIRLVWRRKGCPCLPSKEQRLARQLDNQATNGQIMTLNPSTDLLVAAQYGPVSEIAYQPPQHDVEETRKLMANDNKECTDESERMLESDPRIVLRPLSHTDEA